MKAIRFLGKFLKWFLFSLLSLAMVVALAVFIVLQKPSLLINNRTLSLGATMAKKKAGISLTWTNARVEVHSQSLLKKQFTLAFEDLGVQEADGSLDARFPKASLAVAADFSGFIPKLTQIGPIDIDSSRLVIASAPDANAKKTESEKPKKKSSSRINLVDLKRFSIEPIHIALHDIEMEGRKAQLSLDAEPDHHEGAIANYQVRAVYDAKPQYVQARVDGAIRTREINGTINAVARFSPTLEPARVDGCGFRFYDQGKIHVDCPVRARIPLPPKTWPDFKVPTEIGGKLLADLTSASFPPAPDEKIEGNIGILIDPVLSPLFTGQGRIDTHISGIPREFPKKGTLKSKLDLKVAVPKFGRLVHQLRKGPWAIPAPLNPLRGQVTLAIQGEIDPRGGKIPLQLQTRLHSKTEKLNVDAGGTVSLDRLQPAPIVNADVTVNLTEVTLELPRLSLEAPPRFSPDTRIHKTNPHWKKEKQQAAQEANEIHYKVHVVTPPTRPLEIVSNLAKAPVPIAIDVTSTDQDPIGGQVGIRDFPVNLFKRDAVVDHLNVALTTPTGDSDLDGKVNVKYADYTVTIQLVGTIDKPEVQLQSDPPLDQQQLVAVLLFGRTLDELDPDQSSSVGNTRAALADSAIGLASLYALASTPIESVGYNSVTGIVSAKFKLAEGLSLNVGAGSGDEELGLRKRLGPHWSINTDFNHPSEPTGQQNTVSAFLEWSNRY